MHTQKNENNKQNEKKALSMENLQTNGPKYQ